MKGVGIFLDKLIYWYDHVQGYLKGYLDTTGLPILSCFFTEIIAVLAIICILMAALRSRESGNTESFMNGTFNFLIAVIFSLIYALTRSEFMYYYNALYEGTTFYSSYHFTSSPLLLAAKYFLLILTLITVVIHKSYFIHAQENGEYSIIVLTMVVAMLLMISSSDLIVAGLVMELQSFCLFIFMSLKRYSNLSVEAVVKMFIYTTFSGGCFLFGISLIYAMFGTTNFNELHDLILVKDIPEMALPVLLILVGLFIKLTIAPFYFGVGDVYQGTFNYVASYISIVTKLPAGILLIKILDGPFNGIAAMYGIPLLQGLAILSIIVGSVYSLTEYNFRRFGALSSLTHMGFILLSICSQNGDGWVIAMFYIIVYSLSTIFIGAIVLHLYPANKDNIQLKEFLINLFEFTMIKKSNKLLSLLASLMILSLGGIPIGLGFLPKVLIFYQLYLQGHLAILAIVFFFNLISMAYYLRLIRIVIFNVEKEEKQVVFDPLPRPVLYILVIIFIVNFLFFIFFGIDLYLLFKSNVSG